MFKKLTLATVLACSLLASACSSGETASAPQKMTEAQVETSGFAQMEQRAHGFEVGSLASAKTAYVFFDPQCPHCGHMWEAAKPLLDKVHMVWVPVGVLSQMSAPQGAVLIASTNPLVSMQAHEDSILARTGGLNPSSAKKAQLDQVNANTSLFKEMGFEGVPVMIYKDAAGKTKTIVGSLSTEQIATSLGLK